MKKKFKITLGLLVAIPLIVFFYVWYQFHSSIHFHVAPMEKTPAQYNLTVQKQQIKSQDGKKIALWYIPVSEPKAVVILIHGYDDTKGGKSEMLGRAQFLNRAGYSTILLDLRSFGDSEGNKIHLGTKEWQDAAAAYDFAKALPENKNQKIGYLGDSLGAVTALIAVSQTQKGDFLILEAPFANYSDMLEEQIKRKKYHPFLVPILHPLLRLATGMEIGFDYETLAPARLIKKINTPIFIISAENDKWVGKEAGKKLFDLANPPKEFWHAPTSHNVFEDDPETMKNKILEFLLKYT